MTNRFDFLERKEKIEFLSEDGVFEPAKAKEGLPPPDSRWRRPPSEVLVPRPLSLEEALLNPLKIHKQSEFHRSFISVFFGM